LLLIIKNLLLMEPTKEQPHMLSYEQAYQFFEYLLEERTDLNLQLQAKKNALVALDTNYDPWFELKFPLPYPAIEGEDDQTENPVDYFAKTSTTLPDYLMLLIQAGSAALGYFEEGEMSNHKVVRKYMIRKKQGKFQGSHLKTKGKSKYGSRVRLNNTLEFFEDINQKLEDWEIVDEVDRILYFASIPLWNMLFESKVPCPFEKEDTRLRKIPKDVQIPHYDELLRINTFAQSGWVHIYQPIDLDEFFEQIQPQELDDDEW